VVAVRGNFDAALKVVRELAEEYPITLVNSLNPYRLEGQKTAAFEVCDALGAPPDYLSIPVGNAGNITAYWRGFKDYATAGKIESLPKMIGFQAAGAAPIVLGHPVDYPETIATAIRIGNPARWQEAVSAAQDSGGFIDMVTDDEILEAYKLIASTEGVFAEPASAASVAGLIKAVNEGRVARGSTVVCVLTGHGLKDPDTAIKTGGRPVEAEATVSAVERVIFG
jgi:threonine synthase